MVSHVAYDMLKRLQCISVLTARGSDMGNGAYPGFYKCTTSEMHSQQCSAQLQYNGVHLFSTHTEGLPIDLVDLGPGLNALLNGSHHCILVEPVGAAGRPVVGAHTVGTHTVGARIVCKLFRTQCGDRAEQLGAYMLLQVMQYEL